MANKLAIKLKRSSIGSSKRQLVTLQTLGLRKREQVVTHQDNPTIRGMINQVKHLVEVQEVQE